MFTNCKKNEEVKVVPDFNLTTIANWPTIDFKAQYTIQVPAEFIGPGVQQGFEGNSFSKSSADGKIQLHGGFGTILGIMDFGMVLPNPVPAEVQIRNNNSELVTLDNREIFYQNAEIIAYFYYSNNTVSKGELYWYVSNAFLSALSIDFELSELETVNKIIKSIKLK
jgi:hypothetical protein